MEGERSRNDQLETILQDSNSEPKGLPLEYLKKITNEFANELLLGEGGFGKVYKGVLQNGRIVAVKKLFQLKPRLQAKQFENEVYHLMRLKHPNIVRFVGYCYEIRNECVEFNGQFLFAEKQQRLLCLEYLSNGSLDRHLSDESSGLDWGTRYKIIKGICCGIHYLHEGCKYQINGSIIHLDLKPANILLDDNMVPKVADFGLSRLFHGTKSQTCTANLAGTLGYMAPEYMYGQVIIIEITTGHRSDPFSLSSTSSVDFVEDVLQKWRNRLKDAPSETDCNQIQLCLEIGLKCFKVDRNERPTAEEIIDSLNKWERRNLVGNGDALSVPDPDPDPDPAVDNDGREGRRHGVAAILSEAQFDQMLLHRNDASSQASRFYTYGAFVTAADVFPAFGTTGDLATQKREIAAFLAQTSHVLFKTAILFWMTARPPKPSCHAAITGQWTPSRADVAAGREPGYGLVTNIIAGGLECGHGPDVRIIDRIGFYKRYCDILGISYGANWDGSNQRPFS